MDDAAGWIVCAVALTVSLGLGWVFMLLDPFVTTAMITTAVAFFAGYFMARKIERDRQGLFDAERQRLMADPSYRRVLLLQLAAGTEPNGGRL